MWWLFPTVCLCGVGELVGWSGRLWSSFSPSFYNPFMMQWVVYRGCSPTLSHFLLLPRIVSTIIAPTPLIAVNFILLSWIVTRLGPCYARLSPRRCKPELCDDRMYAERDSPDAVVFVTCVRLSFARIYQGSSHKPTGHRRPRDSGRWWWDRIHRFRSGRDEIGRFSLHPFPVGVLTVGGLHRVRTSCSRG